MADNANNDKKSEETVQQKKPTFFDSQTFRFLTLIIYLAGLSGLGMTLAFYHLFLWDSKMPPLPVIKPHHPFGG